MHNHNTQNVNFFLFPLFRNQLIFHTALDQFVRHFSPLVRMNTLNECFQLSQGMLENVLSHISLKFNIPDKNPSLDQISYLLE